MTTDAGCTARAETAAALRFQIDATLTDAGRMLAELQETVGSLRTLIGRLGELAATVQAGDADDTE